MSSSSQNKKRPEPEGGKVQLAPVFLKCMKYEKKEEKKFQKEVVEEKLDIE